MRNDWPVVCMTAYAISKLAAERRSRISRQTPARVSGPTAAHSAMASLAAATSSSTLDAG